MLQLPHRVVVNLNDLKHGKHLERSLTHIVCKHWLILQSDTQCHEVFSKMNLLRMYYSLVM